MKELQAIQQQLKAPKNQYNGFGKYKYRSCEDILEAVKPLLNEQACTLTITDEIVMVGARIYVKATATLTNAKLDIVQTTAFAREEDDKKGMDASQVTGAASSYARKYALNGLFCIDDNKDSEYTNHKGKEDAAPAQSAQPTLAEQKEQEWIDGASKCSTKNDLMEFYKSAPEQLRKKGSNFWNYCNQRSQELQ